jgi:tetratricopeptide (TPR) repeat protein
MSSSPDRRPPIPQVYLIVTFLRWMGWGIGVCSAAAALVFVYLLVEAFGAAPGAAGSGGSVAGQIAGAVMLALFPALAGAAAAIGLHGLASLLELQYRAAHAARRLERAVAELADVLDAPPPPMPVNPPNTGNTAVLDALSGLRDVFLMDENDRKARRAAIAEEEIRVRRLEIDTAVGRKEMTQARKIAEALAIKFPENYDVQRLKERVSAQEKNHQLQEADRLAEQAEKAAGREHWREALRLAQKLIAEFPDSPPADFARSGLDTLRRNAEIEMRRELEDRYKDYLSRGLTQDALATAEMIVRDYPDSPQAAALRERIPVLREQAGTAKE